MSLGDKILNKTANIIFQEDEMPISTITEPPKTSPGRLLNMQDRIRAAEEKMGVPIKISIAQLLPSPFQTRQLDLKRVDELAEHLEKNRLATPIVVRSTSIAQEFEIVSGHHRVAAYKKLEREDIDAIICQIDDASAEKQVFFDNLMAPDLPDFEKYKGFAAIRKRTGWSYEELAKEAGISKTLVSFYFSFEKLPACLIEKLHQHPSLIGATTAQKIFSLKASDEYIMLALEEMINGKMNQKEFISFLKNSSETGNNFKKEKEKIVIHHRNEIACTFEVKSAQEISLKFNKSLSDQNWLEVLKNCVKEKINA